MYLYVDTSNMCHVEAHSMADEALRGSPYTIAVQVAQNTAMSARVNKAKRVYFFCDSREGSWRKKIFPEYKAQREEKLAKGDPLDKIKHDLADVAAKEIMPELIPLLGCPVFQFPFLEADDLCAAATLLNPSMETVILTSDKDYWQLLNRNISTVNTQHGYKVRLDENGKLIKDKGDGTCESMDLTPEEYLLAKVLMGDNSDNIPGLIGVGEVTAAKVVREKRMVTFLAEQTGMITPRKSKTNPSPVPVQQDATAVVKMGLTLSTLSRSSVIDKAKVIVNEMQVKGVRGFENHFTRLSLWLEQKAGFGPDVSHEIAKNLSQTFQGVWVQ